MHGGRHERSERRLHERGALRAHFELRAQDRLCRGGSEADDDTRFDEVDFRFQPGATGFDLEGIRLLVNASFSARLKLEMLDHVGHIDLRSIDSRRDERLVEKTAGRTDEWLSLQIFLIARLLADKHHRRSLFSFAENRLRSGSPQIAGLAPGGRDLKFPERWARRHQRRSVALLANHARRPSIARSTLPV